MNRSTRLRLKRARHTAMPAPKVDLSGMTAMERLLWAAQNGTFETIVRQANDEWRAEPPAEAQSSADDRPEPTHEREPEAIAEVMSAAPPADAEPPPEPWRPSYPGEPDPNYVPPPQNEWWQERCHFRVRRLDEPYDDDPPEMSEDDELIYGD
jgi:hypothetical protein